MAKGYRECNKILLVGDMEVSGHAIQLRIAEY